MAISCTWTRTKMCSSEANRSARRWEHTWACFGSTCARATWNGPMAGSRRAEKRPCEAAACRSGQRVALSPIPDGHARHDCRSFPLSSLVHAFHTTIHVTSVVLWACVALGQNGQISGRVRVWPRLLNAPSQRADKPPANEEQQAAEARRQQASRRGL